MANEQNRQLAAPAEDEQSAIDTIDIDSDKELNEVEKLVKATIDQGNSPQESSEEPQGIEDLTLAEEKRLANRPTIDHFEDAISPDGSPKFTVGDRIIVEMVLPSGRWLETRNGIVKSINADNGDIGLLDTDVRQMFYSNFVKGPSRGYRFKLVPKTTVNGRVALTKRRGRPRKGPEKIAKPVELDANGKPIKRKRGRPKGTKNRPRDVVKAERDAQDKIRDEKRVARQARKRGLRMR